MDLQEYLYSIKRAILTSYPAITGGRTVEDLLGRNGRIPTSGALLVGLYDAGVEESRRVPAAFDAVADVDVKLALAVRDAGALASLSSILAALATKTLLHAFATTTGASANVAVLVTDAAVGAAKKIELHGWWAEMWTSSDYAHTSFPCTLAAQQDAAGASIDEWNVSAHPVSTFRARGPNILPHPMYLAATKGCAVKAPNSSAGTYTVKAGILYRIVDV